MILLSSLIFLFLLFDNMNSFLGRHATLIEKKLKDKREKRKTKGLSIDDAIM